jgi:hypothetical protein
MIVHMQAFGRIALRLTLTSLLLLVNNCAWATLGQSNPADKLPSNVAWRWFEQLYDVVKAENTSPPAASRNYGITAIALYESIVAGTERNRPLLGQLNDLTSLPQPAKNESYHWPTVANSVLANTIRGVFAPISQSSLDSINKLEQRLAAQQRAVVSIPVYERSVMYGRVVTTAILDWATADGFSSDKERTYFPRVVPGAWMPTPPSYNPNSLLPYWGMIRPMVLVSGKECFPPSHPMFSTDPTSNFYAAAFEVYKTGLELTDEQKMIADYWSDGPGTGTPSGHWIAIISQIAQKDDLSLTLAAEAYARVGIAVYDAFIACWKAKYIYNLQRPVTYINTNIDADWLPYLETPNFPTFTSGHSTVSGAVARVLTDMFGVRSFTDTTHIDHHVVPEKSRAFLSFNEAATEAAVSRLYGGIHFSFDNNAGLAAGRCIGQSILDKVVFRPQSPSG